MNAPVQLQQRLGLFDATALVVGSMIGSAVFLALPIMAQQVPSPGILLGLWMFGGLFTILGANCCAELAAMMPRAGGQYVFYPRGLWGLVGVSVRLDSVSDYSNRHECCGRDRFREVPGFADSWSQ